MTHSHREKCFEKKDEECTVCGWGQKVIVHHADGDKTNGAIENLIPLCCSCHRKVHQGAGAEAQIRALQRRLEHELNRATVGASIDPADYDGVPPRAYVTVKETKPGYQFYYFQWRDGDEFKNEYIAPVEDVDGRMVADPGPPQAELTDWA